MAKAITILIVDDDIQLRNSFERILTSEGYSIISAASGEAGIVQIKNNLPDLVVMDIRMPGMNGLQALKEIQRIEPKLPVIIMTAFGTTETAIEATKLGAFDYILKPFDIPNILEIIKKALQAGKFMRSPVKINIEPEISSAESLVGKSVQMQEVYKVIGRAAPTDATVLIRGESGTGKELVARALYHHSLRSDKPFLIINCVAIPETLLESELFGYEKGAFTGAVSRKIGKIEQAHQGAVFLDEIGDMPLSIQAKILRLLQERSIERLGGRKPIPVDVRIIAATNRNLEEAVVSGRFREDLYYRLKVVALWLPALKDRKDDIPLLTDYFLFRFSSEMNIVNPGLTDEAKKILLEYQWPGNVRELSNTIQKLLIFNKGCPFTKKDIMQAIGEDQEKKPKDQNPCLNNFDVLLKPWISKKLTENIGENFFDSMMDNFASILIRETLNYTNGNRTKASKILGVSRPTLIAKIEKYGLIIETSVS
ncbi:MAG: sigma-54-dependent Fis family transcriptional regulator [Desulfobacterales bacterium]|nr:sigma-54-dependent Fis family transcriptional regulator [Desulfobacterales bacterium]